MPRKRTHDEMEASETPRDHKEVSLLSQIRNMWEFASVMQYIFFFGKAVKIDEDFDIEDFETECLKPGHSEKLEEIGLTLLKWISSHRGLNYDIWDEYTRRQYVSKAIDRNPYGDEEEPKKFRDFDIFQKIRVLHQLTVWTFWNPDRLRERMPEHQREVEQLDWRIEPFGYDRDEREYFLLDDNRLYRRTEPTLPPAPKAKIKANSLKAQAARRRASKRRRIIESDTPEPLTNDEEEASQLEGETQDGTAAGPDANTMGGYTWECLAIRLEDYQKVLESIGKSKDPNEKMLRQRLTAEVIPTIQAAADKQLRKIERRERELLALEKLAGAKRSGRLADKQDKERREHEQAESERKRVADLAAAHKEQEMQEKMDRDRQSRMMTREHRIRDREFKRVLKEEELARDAEEQRKIEEGEARGSGRQLKDRIEKTKKELEDLNAEEDWTFDCSGCGIHGKNIDDGSHSVACEKCSVWQHSKCLGVSKAAAEKDDFHFVCRECKQKEEEANRPKISLKFKVGQSSSPPQAPAEMAPLRSPSPTKSGVVGIEVPRPGSGHHIGQAGNINGYHPMQTSPVISRPQTHSLQGPQVPVPNGLLPQSQITSPTPVLAHPNNATGRSSASSEVNHGPILSPPNGLPPITVPRLGASAQTVQYRAASPHSAVGQATSPSYVHSQTYRSGIPDQHQGHAAVARPQNPQMTPRPYAAPSSASGPSPSGTRLTSPVINHPVIAPTQGNYDVGPVAGVPQKQPTAPHPSGHSPQLNGSPTFNGYQSFNGGRAHQTPQPPSPNLMAHLQARSPTQPVSGLSPIKRSAASPLLPPSHIPQKMSISPPPAPFSAQRAVSGTPIFPPLETFAPSPEQLQKTPVPTPSKQPTPAQVGQGELKRVTDQFERTFHDANGESR